MKFFAKPKISIVICTYRRYELTRKVVQSLTNQTADRDHFEVIVVENDILPHKEIRQIVEDASRIISITYLFENSVGLSNARSAGGKVARASYVGYIDDDAVAPNDYIEKYIEIIDKIKPDIIGGPIYGIYGSIKPPWFRDEYVSTTNNGISGYYDQNQYIAGTSIGFRKNLLEESGWFDSRLGMRGTKLWYGEETMIQIKAWRKHPELKVWFDQRLFIQHLIPVSKMKLRGKFRRSFNTGLSLAYIWLPENKIREVQKRAPWVLLKTFGYFFLKGVPGLVIHDRKKYPFWQNYVYEVFYQYFASIGQELQYTKDLLSGKIHK